MTLVRLNNVSAHRAWRNYFVACNVNGTIKQGASDYLQNCITGNKKTEICITQSPPALKAEGNARMPVPMLPFNRFISACKFL
jgi:hypothetical protein